MSPSSRAERAISAGSARLCAESFGEPGDPPVLLIMGQMASMLWWPEGFCERLAAAGRFVIRYDNRDTGRSTTYERDAPPYSGDDLASDAVAVLDGYGIERAHLAGMSMGGALAQVVGLTFPERVASLTAISTTKFTGPEEGLPGSTDSYREHAATADDLDWSDAEAVKDFIVRDMRALAGTGHEFDEAAARAQVERDFARAGDPLAMTNHMLLDGGGEGLDLADLEAPLLVIHGSADPFLPHAHAEALAAAVPGSRLVTIDGGGHELHPGDWDQVVETIAAHTSSS